MVDQNQIDAKTIAQELLDETGAALLSGDFKRFAPHFFLPQVLSLEEEKVLVSTEEELRATFENRYAFFASMKIDVIHRYIDSAAYVSPTQIHSTHVSDLLSGANRLRGPYPVFSILRLVEGKWVIEMSDYAVPANSCEGLALKSSGTVLPKTRPIASQTPLPIGEEE